MHNNERRMILLNPGPANTTEGVKQAMTSPDICPREREFGEAMLAVREGLVRVVHDGDVFTAVLFCGSGTAAVEAAISSVVPADGRLLVVANGSYGQRVAEMARAYGMAHDVISFGVGGWPNPEAIAEKLDAGRFSHLFVVHHETSTGMLNPVSEIAACCHERGVETIVDAMSSYAGLPMDVEALGADYLVSSANKCIQGMAGLSFVICRRKTLESMEPVAGRSLYLNLPLQHRFFETSGQMRYTPPVQVVYALAKALEEYFAEEGGAGRHRRYRQCFEALDGGMRGLGFRRLLPEEQLSGILTAYVEPDHSRYGFDELHDHLYAKGFTIYPGKGAKESTFRLANMGAVTADDMRAFISAMAETLAEMEIDTLYGEPV
ncbi:MAG: 2-aminoethylphosphonate--pyruvate transaminase [Deltaproteobacteria bacterium]|nr:2-aminoethylphosphonate--pyruvate transaminase [Deltaproteobacteria bacterium]